MGNTTHLNQLGIALAEKQDHTIDALTEKTPFLGNMPLMAANKGFTHVFPEWEFIDGNSESYILDMDEPYSEVKAAKKLESVDLFKIGGIIYCPEDIGKNWPGGASNYFTSQVPANAKRFGQQAEYELIYNYFRKRAIDSGNSVNAGSAATGAVSSIVIIRFEQDECMGLYNPTQFSNGFFEVQQVHNGALAPHPTTEVMSYSAIVRGWLGVLLNKGSNRYTSVIANIDANNVPQISDIESALDMARYDEGTAVMVMTPKTRRLLNEKYNTEKMKANIVAGTVEAGITTAKRFYDWDGTPIIPTRNMLDTEATVDFS